VFGGFEAARGVSAANAKAVLAACVVGGRVALGTLSIELESVREATSVAADA
jgi:hypothetical protein